MGTGHVGKGYWGHIYGAVQCNAKHKILDLAHGRNGSTSQVQSLRQNSGHQTPQVQSQNHVPRQPLSTKQKKIKPLKV